MDNGQFRSRRHYARIVESYVEMGGRLSRSFLLSKRAIFGEKERIGI